MLQILLIAGGGAVGAVARYLLSGAAQHATSGSFPVGTLVVNTLGCLLIGLFGYALLEGPVTTRPEFRLALLVGVLGGFTTFSTFGWETIELFRTGNTRGAVLNIVLSNFLCLGAAWIGFKAAQRSFGG